ncbi:MAG: hypothetical protein Ct9H90mP18_03240 [Gammaproteobacteria bacterium]|nr:MAG: hypothetical protein Ct9H90mP18_03240 [Gammaproteobacteria bacterium]
MINNDHKCSWWWLVKKLILDNKEYTSRLILGTGKYKDFEETQPCY